jgi:hypothetical protein
MKPFSVNESFETDVMIEKLTTIKKKKENMKNKKKKEKDRPTQYKNTEPIEIIQDNDNETIPERFRTFPETKNQENINEGMQGPHNTNKFPYLRLASKTGIAEWSNDMFDGLDNVVEEANTNNEIADPRQEIINAINEFFNIIDNAKTILVQSICIFLSRNSYKNPPSSNTISTEPELQNDTIVVKKNMSKLLSVVLAYLMIYNFFYLTFYQRHDGTPPDYYKINEKHMISIEKYPSPIKLIFLKYPIYFCYLITCYLLEIIPSFLKKPVESLEIPSVYYFFPFYLLFILIVYYCSDFLKLFLINLFSIDVNNIQSNNWFLVLIIISIYLTIIAKYCIEDKPIKIMEIMELPTGVYLLIPFGIFLFLYLLVILLISPVVSGIFIYLYILYLFFFSILYNEGFNEYSKIFQYIKDSIKEELKIEENDTELNVTDWLYNKFKQGVNLSKNNLLYFTLFITLIYISVDYSKNIKNTILSTNIQYLNIGLACVTLMILIMYYVFKMYSLNKKLNIQKVDIVKNAFLSEL